MILFEFNKWKCSVANKMFTKSHQLQNFLIYFYNFCGITCIKGHDRNASKLQAYFNFVKFSLTIFFHYLFTYNSTLSKIIYDEDVFDLSNFTSFSIFIMELGIFLFLSFSFFIVVIQSFWYKKVAGFVKKIMIEDKLNERNSKNFRKHLVKNLIFQVIFQILFVIPEIVALSNRNLSYTLFIHSLMSYYYVPNCAFINLLYNFKNYIILMLQQVRNDLNDQKISHSDGINEIREISELMKYFQETFGVQLSIAVAGNTFLLSLLVRCEEFY